MFSCSNETEQKGVNGGHCTLPLTPFLSHPAPSTPQTFPSCFPHWSSQACGQSLRALGSFYALFPVLEAHVWWGLIDWVWHHRFIVTGHFVQFPPLQRGKLRSKFIKERASLQLYNTRWWARTREYRWDRRGFVQQIWGIRVKCCPPQALDLLGGMWGFLPHMRWGLRPILAHLKRQMTSADHWVMVYYSLYSFLLNSLTCDVIKYYI